MGDPDLSPRRRTSERALDLSPQGRTSEQPPGLAGRGLVVFPAVGRPRRRSLLSRYAPFLITISLGAVLVMVVALVR